MRETDQGFDPRTDVLDLPEPQAQPEPQPDPRTLSRLIPAQEPGRQIDDWGRSETTFQLTGPFLDFYYRYWFRVELAERRERAGQRRRAAGGRTTPARCLPTRP